MRAPPGGGEHPTQARQPSTLAQRVRALPYRWYPLWVARAHRDNKKGPRRSAGPLMTSVRRNRRNAGGGRLQNPKSTVGHLRRPGPPTSLGSVRRTALIDKSPWVCERFRQLMPPSSMEATPGRHPHYSDRATPRKANHVLHTLICDLPLCVDSCIVKKR